MPTYLDLFLVILPIFAILCVGVVARRVGWVVNEAETSLVRVVVNVLFPCLIYDTVAGNPAFRIAANVVWPPIIGFSITAIGIVIAYFGGRAIGLSPGHGLRTFALAAGVGNYGYLPLPITGAMWGRDSQGMVLVHNIGVESGIWTLGVLVLSGLSLREGWRKLFNPIVIAMALTLLLNGLGLAERTPATILTIIHMFGICAIPMGLFMVGVTLAAHLTTTGALFDARITLGACLFRLAVIPAILLAVIPLLPVSYELKRVLVVEAAMPSAVFPIILARLYGGQPLTAVQCVIGTTTVGIFTVPLWIRLGLAWIGT